MRSKFAITLLALLAALTLIAVPVMAQTTNIEWNRWDQDITVHSNSDQMQVVETQEVHVLGNTVHYGQRDWTEPVSVQLVTVDGQQLTQNSNNQAGTYSVSQSNNATTLQYNLLNPTPTNGTFTVQITYQANTPTSGMVDWQIVPSDHPFNVLSSTATIHFADGQVPDSSLVHIAQGNGSVQTNGNEMIIQSQGAIPANQAFALQVPYGAGVGAAANNSNPSNPNVSTSGNPTTGTSTDTGTTFNLGNWILPILCIVGILLLFGGGNLIRSLLGGVLGGASPVGPLGGNQGGGIFGGGNQGGGIFGGGNQGSSQRGFRPSSNQDREVPNVGNDKRGGGGARFGR